MPTRVDEKACPEWGIISDGVLKRSGKVVEALCTPAEVFAYAECRRDTPACPA